MKEFKIFIIALLLLGYPFAHGYAGLYRSGRVQKAKSQDAYEAKKNRVEAWEKRVNEERHPPEKVLNTIGVKPGMVVGEIGAGRGRYTVLLAQRVGSEGKIYANDIEMNALSYLQERCRSHNITNIETILGKMDDPLLPKQSLDMAFMIWVFHMIDNPVPLLINLKPSLKPGASLIIIDPLDSEIDAEREDMTGKKTDPNRLNIRQRIEKAADEAGYEFIRVDTILPKDTIFTLKIKKTNGEGKQKAESLEPFFQQADRFFKAHVNNERVDYKSIVENPAMLNRLITGMETVNIDRLDGNMKKAFWINAYNLTVIKSVIDSYPIKSPMDVGGFFDQKKHMVAGKELTLNDIENKILRKKFPDAGIHFALVCAAEGCPPIVPFAYKPRNLKRQILDQTKQALNNKRFIRVDEGKKQVLISEIFRWYEGDFTREAGSLRDYINRYREIPLHPDYTIGFYPYNWILNEFKKKEESRDNQPASNIHWPQKRFL